jgi:hypothetical protein
MVTPRRRIASPSFTSVVADPTPVANRARPAHVWPHVAGRRLGRPQNRTRPLSALVWPHVGAWTEGPAAGGAASGLSCLPEAIH